MSARCTKVADLLCLSEEAGGLVDQTSRQALTGDPGKVGPVERSGLDPEVFHLGLVG